MFALKSLELQRIIMNAEKTGFRYRIQTAVLIWRLKE